MSDLSNFKRARDLDSPEAIDFFVDKFYSRVKKDARLSAIFFGFAKIDLDLHLPHIRNYWRKLLLADPSYNRHTMNIHRDLNEKVNLRTSDFERWLVLFTETVDDEFLGPIATRAKRLARNIAINMQSSLKIGID